MDYKITLQHTNIYKYDVGYKHVVFATDITYAY